LFTFFNVVLIAKAISCYRFFLTEKRTLTGITMDKKLQDFILNDTATISLTRFALNLVVAAILSLILAWLYRRNAKTFSNRSSFSSNFLLLTMTTTLIITVVKTSLALSLGLVGALSIVRFRAAIKEPEELNFLFICIAIGLGLGANQLVLTLQAFAMIGVAIYLRGQWTAQGNSKSGNLFIRHVGSKEIQLAEIVKVIEGTCRTLSLLRFDESADAIEASFNVVIDKFEDLEKVRSQLTDRFPSAEITYMESTPIFDEN
jgi:hypothetical protein